MQDENENEKREGKKYYRSYINPSVREIRIDEKFIALKKNVF